MKKVKTAIFDCYSGISGDMLIGAFLALGVPLPYLRDVIGKLKLDGIKLEKSIVTKHHFMGVKFGVLLSGKDHPYRHYSNIKEIILGSNLSEGIKTGSLNMFKALAAAEADVHGCGIDNVHFHEVGALDSIVDIVGIAASVEYLGIENFYVRNLFLGSGIFNGSHGAMPLPAPATAHLLKGFKLNFGGVVAELVTPTGAVFISSYCRDMREDIDFVCEKIGYGAGERDLNDRANLLRVFLGSEITDGNFVKEKLTLIETNIDDLPPVIAGNLFEKFFNAGVSDFYLTPILMKKNRQAFKLSILVAPGLKENVLKILFAETTTIGARYYEVDRVALKREEVMSDTEYGKVRCKKVVLPDGKIRVVPEYEDCRAISDRTGIPLITVMSSIKNL